MNRYAGLGEGKAQNVNCLPSPAVYRFAVVHPELVPKDLRRYVYLRR